MQTLYAGMAIAAAAGALFGGAMQSNAFQANDRPRGPQQIYSMPNEYGEEEAYAYSTIEFRSGPYADFVIGTDWLPGGRHDRARQYALTSYTEPEAYEPVKVSLYSDYEMPTPSPATYQPLRYEYGSVAEAKSAADAATEAVEIAPVDDEAGGQIYDLAHRADEQAFVEEPVG